LNFQRSTVSPERVVIAVPAALEAVLLQNLALGYGSLTNLGDGLKKRGAIATSRIGIAAPGTKL